MNKCDLSDRNTFFASDSLLEEAKGKNSDLYVNFAYNSYGGYFYDNVVIQYMKEHHAENIVLENTSWNGCNAFLFGDVASEFLEESRNDVLGFEDLEDFYFTKEYNAKIEGLKELGYTEGQIYFILEAKSCGELNINVMADGSLDCNTYDIDNVLSEHYV